MNMTKKFAAAFAVLALTAGAQAATIDIGSVDFTTDYFNTATWAAKSSAQTDLYTFSVVDAGEYSGTAQAVTPAVKFSFADGELSLFEAGSNTLIKHTSFDVGGATLTDYLAVGNYYFEVQGETTGSKGGRYNIEVSAVPEPANVALMLAGLGIIGGLARRRLQG